MPAKKAQSGSKPAKPPKAIKWRSSEVYHLRSMLAHVQSKLDRIHLLGPRLAVEAPEMQVGDLISRLRKRKKELIKKISEEDKKILKRRPKSGGVPKGGGGDYEAELYIPPPEDMEAWLRSKMDSLVGKPRNFFAAGVVEPEYFREKAYEKLSLNRNSKEDYHADLGLRSDYDELHFRATLTDNTACQDQDDPSLASRGSEFIYTIPPPDRDAIVHLSFGVRVYNRFLNAADHGGLLVHSLVVNHTDPDGNWPPWPVGIYSEVEPNQIVFLDTKETGYYLSPLRTFNFALETKRDRQPALFLLFVTHLSAQDGKVDTEGYWYVRPKVQYHFARA